MKELNKQFKALPPEEIKYWKDKEAEDKMRYMEQLKQANGVRRVVRPPRTYNSTKRNLKKNRINISESFPQNSINFEETIQESFDVSEDYINFEETIPETVQESFEDFINFEETIPETVPESFDENYINFEETIDEDYINLEEAIFETFDVTSFIEI